MDGYKAELSKLFEESAILKNEIMSQLDTVQYE